MDTKVTYYEPEGVSINDLGKQAKIITLMCNGENVMEGKIIFKRDKLVLLQNNKEVEQFLGASHNQRLELIL